MLGQECPSYGCPHPLTSSPSHPLTSSPSHLLLRSGYNIAKPKHSIEVWSPNAFANLLVIIGVVLSHLLPHADEVDVRWLEVDPTGRNGVEAGMKIAILYGPGDLRIEEQPLPEQLGPTEIRVKTRISALKIGTDRGNYEGAEQVPGAPDFPRWVGDSNLGVVTQIGANVNEFSVGDRVIGNLPHQSEYVADQSAPIVRVPEGVDDDDAVYGWLYNLSAFCYRKALFQPGEFVAVVGLGVLGLGAVGVGANIGARVIGIGNSEIRLDMARKMGAEVAFLYNDPNLHDKLNEFTGGHGVDLVIQTANPWPALRSSCEIVRNNGRVSIVALPGRGEPPLEFNPLDMKWFYNKGISLIAVSGLGGNVFAAEDDLTRRKQDCQFVLSLMRDARLEPKRLITHRFPYQEMQQAYDMALRREKDMLGVIFEW